jgi:hypothetical protein
VSVGISSHGAGLAGELPSRVVIVVLNIDNAQKVLEELPPR